VRRSLIYFAPVAPIFRSLPGEDQIKTVTLNLMVKRELSVGQLRLAVKFAFPI
jgi:hypothetical protein